MVTGSHDKTARLWDISDGSRKAPKLLRTLRPPIGPGDDGKVYAVALFPDGKWVAAGGWDVHAAKTLQVNVYIFEAVTGRLVRRLGKLGNVIYHLTFSPDGRHLAATLGGGEGLRVWETGGWTEVSRDTDYGGADSYGAMFDRRGRLWTVAYDGTLRRYDPRPDGKGVAVPPRTVKTSGGRRPYSVAVHPNGDQGGGRVAVGFSDSTAVEVYDAETLARRFAADTAGVDNGELSTVAWSADGTRLFAGGLYDVGGLSQLRVWGEAGRGPGRDLRGPLNSINDLLPCGDAIALGAATLRSDWCAPTVRAASGRTPSNRICGSSCGSTLPYPKTARACVSVLDSRTRSRFSSIWRTSV